VRATSWWQVVCTPGRGLDVLVGVEEVVVEVEVEVEVVVARQRICPIWRLVHPALMAGFNEKMVATATPVLPEIPLQVSPDTTVYVLEQTVAVGDADVEVEVDVVDVDVEEEEVDVVLDVVVVVVVVGGCRTPPEK